MEHKYVTLSDLVPAPANDDDVTTLYYITDEVQQSQYINMFKEQEIDAIYLTHQIDTTFITHLEQRNPEVKFLRIDSELTDKFKETIDENEEKELTEKLSEKFKKATGVENLSVKVEKLKDDKVASMAVLSEENRRMQEMMKMYGMSGMDPSMFGSQAPLVLNANHPLVKFIAENQESEHVPVICEQLYDLAMMSHKQLSSEEMTKFVKRSNDILMVLTK